MEVDSGKKPGVTSEAQMQKLIARIGLINFGAANVTRTELEYAYNFLPF